MVGKSGLLTASSRSRHTTDMLSTTMSDTDYTMDSPAVADGDSSYAFSQELNDVVIELAEVGWVDGPKRIVSPSFLPPSTFATADPEPRQRGPSTTDNINAAITLLDPSEIACIMDTPSTATHQVNLRLT